MSHLELEPIGRKLDEKEGFPNSYMVYDTFRGRVFIGTIFFMTNLKMFRTTSVYASGEELKDFSIDSSEKWKGDVCYENTSPTSEAEKLHKIYRANLNIRERTARILDKWWPVCVGFWAIIGTILKTIEVIW